jgi:nucleoside-diphosphate-sugar epimerase
MRYLILGSSGQIGCPLTEFLKGRGHSVEPFDLALGPDMDLRNIENGLLLQKMNDADFVIFLAFDVGGSNYLRTRQHTFEFIDSNVTLMHNGFACLRQTKKPFIFASSQMSGMTHSSYGILKTLGEFYTEALGGVYVRLWNVFGPEHDPAKAHVITDFINMARNEKRIRMFTKGLEERQFLYCDDLSACLETLSHMYEQLDRSKPLHISSFKWSRILDVAEIVGRLFGVPIEPGVAEDEIQKGHRIAPDPFILSLWSPKYSLEEGIVALLNKQTGTTASGMIDQDKKSAMV